MIRVRHKRATKACGVWVGGRAVRVMAGAGAVRGADRKKKDRGLPPLQGVILHHGHSDRSEESDLLLVMPSIARHLTV